MSYLTTVNKLINNINIPKYILKKFVHFFNGENRIIQKEIIVLTKVIEFDDLAVTLIFDGIRFEADDRCVILSNVSMYLIRLNVSVFTIMPISHRVPMAMLKVMHASVLLVWLQTKSNQIRLWLVAFDRYFK